MVTASTETSEGTLSTAMCDWLLSTIHGKEADNTRSHCFSVKVKLQSLALPRTVRLYHSFRSLWHTPAMDVRLDMIMQGLSSSSTWYS